MTCKRKEVIRMKKWLKTISTATVCAAVLVTTMVGLSVTSEAAVQPPRPEYQQQNNKQVPPPPKAEQEHHDKDGHHPDGKQVPPPKAEK